MPNITENPDYRLVMTFLQNIRPGDMDQESSEQLMMIGQRIEAGGALTDREREMFESVVGNMPMDPNSAVRAGEMPMDPGSAVRQSEMPMQNQMPTDPNSAVRPSEMPSQDGMSYSPSSGVTSAMPSADGVTYSKSSGVTPANNVMSMDDAIAAGLVNPTRPQARPTAPTTSLRPQARPMR